MFAIYPYFPSFHVPAKGLSGHVGADVRMVFWSISVPSYDRYGFAGYQQTDFGEFYNLTVGSSYLAYSTGKVAVALFYNDVLTGNVKVDTLTYTYDHRNFGGGIAFSPLKWLALGLDAFLTPKDRGGGVDFTLRYEYLAHLSGGVFYTTGGIRYDLSGFLAFPDPRMSSLGIYLSNAYGTSLLLRYETNITRNRRIKLGGGFIYDSTYTPVFSIGEREKLGRYDLGFDVTVFPVRYDLKGMRVEWNDVKLGVWVGF